MIGDLVICHSGTEYAERPKALVWQDQTIQVIAIEKSWRTPEGKFFQVNTGIGSIFQLFFDEQMDEWIIKKI